MDKIKKGLGRGLSSLIGETKVETQKNRLGVSDLVPNKYQPRKIFDEENLDELPNEDVTPQKNESAPSASRLRNAQHKIVLSHTAHRSQRVLPCPSASAATCTSYHHSPRSLRLRLAGKVPEHSFSAAVPHGEQDEHQRQHKGRKHFDEEPQPLRTRSRRLRSSGTLGGVRALGFFVGLLVNREALDRGAGVLDALLPVESVELPHLHRRHRPTVEAREGDAPAFGVGTRLIKGTDAAASAKEVTRDTGAPAILGEVLDATAPVRTMLYQFERPLGHHEMKVAPHAAVSALRRRTV